MKKLIWLVLLVLLWLVVYGMVQRWNNPLQDGVDAIKNAWEVVVDTAKDWVEVVGEAADDVVDWAANVVDDVTNTAKGAAEWAVDTVKDVADDASNTVKDGVNEMADAAKEVVDWATEKVEEAVDAVKDTVDGEDDNIEIIMEHEGYQEFDQEAFDVAVAWGKNVVLFFHASRCPSCIALDKDLKENKNDIADDTVIFQVNYDEATDLKQEYKVNAQHTLVYVDENKEVIKTERWSATLTDIVENIQ